MATTRAFAYNTGGSISGTQQDGNLAIGTDDTLDFSQDPGGVKWWEGPDESVGYIIAAPNPSGNPTNVGTVAYLGFWRTTNLSDSSFINLVNVLPARQGQMPFTGATDASDWLTANGYFTTYGTGMTAITGQTAIILTTTDSSNNWHYVIMNFMDNTISSPVDLGIDSSTFYSNYDFAGNDKGYLIIFHNNGDTNDQRFYFISANGVIVDSMSFNNSSNYSSDPNIAYIVNEGVELKYFDGLNVYTRDISSYSNFEIPYYYELGGLDGGILTRRTDGGTTSYIEYNYQGTVNLLLTYNNADYVVDPFNYNDSTYTYLVRQHTSGEFYRLTIYDNITGSLLQQTALDDYNFTNVDQYDYFGNGKFITIFYNGSDTSVPWRMIYYDGVRNIFSVTDQPNDSNFTNSNIQYGDDNPYASIGNPAENLFVLFYGNTNSYNNFMHTYDYFKTYTFTDGSATPSVYVLNDTGSNNNTAIYPYTYGSGQYYYSFIYTGGTNASILVLGDSTETIIPTDILLSDGTSDGLNAISYESIGQSIFYQTFSGSSIDYGNFNLFIIGKTSVSTFGIKAVSPLINSSSNSVLNGNGFVYFFDNTNSSALYYNNNTTGFTETYYYLNMNEENESEYYNPPYFTEYDNFLIYDNSTLNGFILSKDNYSSEHTFDANNGTYYFKVGKSGLIYVYGRASDGLIIIDFYDFNLSRTQRIVTNETSIENVYADKDRYFVITDSTNAGHWILYEIWSTSYNSIELPNTQYPYPSPNDQIYN
jgi:hypothetical protein